MIRKFILAMAVAGFILAAALAALIRGVAWPSSTQAIPLSDAAALMSEEST